ncbi:MAG: hypothetical protein ACOYKG_08530 [Ilumatobacteraceae bacterium]
MTFRRVVAVTVFVVIAGCSTGTESLTTQKFWRKVQAPVVTDSTDEVVVTNSRIADGTYWTWVERVLGTESIVFHVARVRMGATCEAWAKENGMQEGCMDDYAVDQNETALVDISETARVTVAFQDGPGTSYEINTSLLKMLMAGTATSPISKYHWVPFPFISRIKNNTVVEAQQMWVP